MTLLQPGYLFTRHICLNVEPISNLNGYIPMDSTIPPKADFADHTQSGATSPHVVGA